MYYSASTTPRPDDAAALEAAATKMRVASNFLDTMSATVRTDVRAVTWTGRWATDVRRDLDETTERLRVANRQMDSVVRALGTHARWLYAERDRLRDLETRVRAEIAAQAAAADEVEVCVYPESYTWFWDDFAVAKGIGNLGVNAEEQNRSIEGGITRYR